MSKTMFIVFSILLLMIGNIFAEGNVKDLTPETFDSVVDGSKAAFVEFFAPWCGHCKKLAPEYELVGDAFAKLSSDVVIAKVDCDKHKDLGSRFGVRGYPTLKFFPKGSKTAEDYSGGREAQDIVDFINNKVGVRVRLPGKGASDVVVLDPNNFDDVVKNSNKHVFVEFYAPWCGHCKKLAPIWEKLATVFKNEKDVVIANLDADKHKVLGQRYGVTGFPTLKFFPKDNKAEPLAYNDPRELNELVRYINLKAGTRRKTDGRLDATAGRVNELDDLVKVFIQNPDKRTETLQTAEALATKTGGDSLFYVKYMKSFASKGNDFVTAERERISKMIDGGNLAPTKLDEFVVRQNILSQFSE